MGRILIAAAVFIFSCCSFLTSTTSIPPSSSTSLPSSDSQSSISSPFPSTLYSIYHEYHLDLFHLIQYTITSSQVYLEIQDTSTPYYQHLFPIIQYLDHGAVFIQTQNCQELFNKFQNSTLYCLNGILYEIIEDDYNLNSIHEYLQQATPAFIRCTHNTALLLYNSHLLQLKKSLFYVENQYSIYSKEIIQMFLSSGYDVFWHLSLVISQSSLQNIPLNYLLNISTNQLISINIIAIPQSVSPQLYSRFSKYFSKETFFPYREGLYHIDLYHRYIVFKDIPVQNSTNFITKDLFIVKDEAINMRKYTKEGYNYRHIQQHSGYWNENQIWQYPLDSDYLLPPPRYFNSLPPDHDEILVPPNKANCGYVTMKIKISHFIDHQSHQSDHINQIISLYFPPQLQLLDIVRGVENTCNQLAVDHEGFQLDICRIFLFTMYQEISKSQFCESFPLIDTNRLPLTIFYEPDYCTEPIWCNHTIEMQKRLTQWQYPSTINSPKHMTLRQQLGCQHGKFLIYQPNYHHPNGLPGLILELAFLLRFAICHGRILYLQPLHLMENSFVHIKSFLSNFCELSLLECLFQPLSPCILSDSDILTAPILRDDRQLNAYPLRESRIVRLVKLPTNSHCSACNMPWTGNVELFDGLHIGLLGYVMTASDGIIDTTILDILDSDGKDMSAFSIFMETQSVFWMSQMIRYILRPRHWFSLLLREYIRNHLVVSPSFELVYPNEITQTYAAFHVTVNDSIISDPLSRYMQILQSYTPHIQHIYIFIPESSSYVIELLVSNYPDYTFYVLQFDSVTNTMGYDHKSQSFENVLYSMASLEIASHAVTFIGNLHTPWDQLVNTIQRTRGDSGSDYYSVEPTATGYSTCVK